jgi:hypothetical protein
MAFKTFLYDLSPVVRKPNQHQQQLGALLLICSSLLNSKDKTNPCQQGKNKSMIIYETPP